MTIKQHESRIDKNEKHVFASDKLSKVLAYMDESGVRYKQLSETEYEIYGWRFGENEGGYYAYRIHDTGAANELT